MNSLSVHVQENDLEREIGRHREHADYTRADTWKWVIAGMSEVASARMKCIVYSNRASGNSQVNAAECLLSNYFNVTYFKSRSDVFWLGLAQNMVLLVVETYFLRALLTGLCQNLHGKHL